MFSLTNPAYAQESAGFGIQTDHKVYPWSGQEFYVKITILISKEKINESESLRVLMHAPDGATRNLASTLVHSPSGESNFVFQTFIPFPSNTPAGTYKLVATYSNYTTETSFVVESSLVPDCTKPNYCTLPLQVAGITYEIAYRTGLSNEIGIRNITGDTIQNLIALDIIAVRSTSMIIALPRDLIKAVQYDNGTGAEHDVKFTILVDGKNRSANTGLPLKEEEELYGTAYLRLENATEKYRVVGAKVTQDSRRIEIIGTEMPITKISGQSGTDYTVVYEYPFYWYIAIPLAAVGAIVGGIIGFRRWKRSK